MAQKTTFSNPESFKKIFGVSGDLMEYNERGKPLKRLSSLTNPNFYFFSHCQVSNHYIIYVICFEKLYIMRKNIKVNSTQFQF